MNYKLHYEPVYADECIAVLTRIINNTSIREEMEEMIQKRGESTRPVVESLFRKSIEIEKHVKKQTSFSLPGYEDSGEEMARFLFTKWENTEGMPIDAIRYYELISEVGIDNKAIVIIYSIGLALLEQVYSMSDIEAGVAPPSIADSEFFALINQSPLSQEDRLKALNFYYCFSTYRKYVALLLERTEQLIKDITIKYTDEIKAHMDAIEDKLITKNGMLLENPQIDISTQDNLEYQIYPRVYETNSFTMTASGLSPTFVTIGLSVYRSDELGHQANLEEERAKEFLKLLGDSTKQEILQLLKEESLYGSQLAEKLNCTGANVSQQMNSLLKLEVVSIRKENNRIYYYPNKETINKYLDVAKKMFG